MTRVPVLDPLIPFPSVRFVQGLPPVVLTCHWSVGAGFPVTPAEKLTGWPAITVSLGDCKRTPDSQFTVSGAGLLVAAGLIPLLATHWYWLPFSAAVAPVIVSVAVVVPLYGAASLKFVQVLPPFPLTCHW